MRVQAEIPKMDRAELKGIVKEVIEEINEEKMNSPEAKRRQADFERNLRESFNLPDDFPL